jgi:hypothetical protein
MIRSIVKHVWRPILLSLSLSVGGLSGLRRVKYEGERLKVGGDEEEETK